MLVVGKILGWKDDVIDYDRRPATRTVMREVLRYADRIRKAEAGPGDLVLMNFGGESTHFGMLTDRGVIHAMAKMRRVVEHGIPDEAVAYFRLKGVPPWLS